MNEQTPRPDSGAGHDVPEAFSSSAPASTPQASTPRIPTSETPDASATAETTPLPDPAFTPPAAPYAAPSTDAYAGASAFGPAAQPGAHDTVAAAPTEKKARVGAGKVTAIMVAAALVGGAAGVGGTVLGSSWTQQSTSTPAAGPSTVTVNNPESVSEATAIATKTVPSVVTIEVSGGSAGGSGSGVVLDDKGHILTNAHVVTLDGQVADPAIRVTTSDGRLMNATVVGIDPVYDLAVIQVEDGSDLTPIEFADSSDLNVGSLTVAVGAPLGLSNSVTTGIVSALNRSIQIQSSALPDESNAQGDGEQPPQDENQQPFQFDLPGRSQGSQSQESISISVIQTDAAINPGNSGGALVNSKGELIGINVAIASAGSSSSEQSGSIGVGFAIPSDVAKRVSSEIIENGEATHGLLGATVQPASALENASVVGAAIKEISDGGAAQKAGLQAGDIVTEFNGAPITDSIDLTAQVRAAAAGSDVEITIVRNGKTQTVTATLGSLVL
ncbi:trypsin-like peptidase domain-containing protein [Microbacterium pseudoresistens]|uniref:Putative serine protease PepD n=1 Tax=Microbacterium pseudoresistens TaxID=640634 RepID=A0A7Y9JMV9_9MICO|nr:trypsin-like peptidase domain-containing protein [Microbacterium pseudoresistens]NYD52989.1 putative serine protease PepD [Microbacterium pseudoresistens]